MPGFKFLTFHMGSIHSTDSATMSDYIPNRSRIFKRKSNVTNISQNRSRSYNRMHGTLSQINPKVALLMAGMPQCHKYTLNRSHTHNKYTRQCQKYIPKTEVARLTAGYDETYQSQFNLSTVHYQQIAKGSWTGNLTMGRSERATWR